MFRNLPSCSKKSSSFIWLDVIATGWNCDGCWFTWWKWEGRFFTCNKTKMLNSQTQGLFPRVIIPFIGIWFEIPALKLLPGNFRKGPIHQLHGKLRKLCLWLLACGSLLLSDEISYAFTLKEQVILHLFSILTWVLNAISWQPVSTNHVSPWKNLPTCACSSFHSLIEAFPPEN